MKTRLAIFDLDGTLFDTRRVNYKSYKYALSQFGYDIGYEWFASEFNGRMYTYTLPKIMGTDEHIEEVHDLKVQKYNEFLSEAVLNDSLFAMIDCMRDDFYTAIVSTATEKNVSQILNYFNVKDKFDLILTQSDVVKKKPDPEGFLKAMSHFGISAGNTIVFEDSQVGLEAAEGAGCVCYMVKGYS